MIPPGHCLPKEGKLKHRKATAREQENLSMSAVGNGFHVGVMSWLLGQGLAKNGLLDQQPTPTQLCMGYLKRHYPKYVKVYWEKLRYYHEVENLSYADPAASSWYKDDLQAKSESLSSPNSASAASPGRCSSAVDGLRCRLG